MRPKLDTSLLPLLPLLSLPSILSEMCGDIAVRRWWRNLIARYGIALDLDLDFVLVLSSLKIDASDIQMSGSDRVVRIPVGAWCLGLERCWIEPGPNNDNCRGFRSKCIKRE